MVLVGLSNDSAPAQFRRRERLLGAWHLLAANSAVSLAKCGTLIAEIRKGCWCMIRLSIGSWS
jgi:hypothetical protein